MNDNPFREALEMILSDQADETLDAIMDLVAAKEQEDRLTAHKWGPSGFSTAS
jgi:hypothetical protein